MASPKGKAAPAKLRPSLARVEASMMQPNNLPRACVVDGAAGVPAKRRRVVMDVDRIAVISLSRPNVDDAALVVHQRPAYAKLQFAPSSMAKNGNRSAIFDIIFISERGMTVCRRNSGWAHVSRLFLQLK